MPRSRMERPRRRMPLVAAAVAGALLAGAAAIALVDTDPGAPPRARDGASPLPGRPSARLPDDPAARDEHGSTTGTPERTGAGGPRAKPAVRPTGTLAIAAGGSERFGRGDLHRLRVEVERGLGMDPGRFAAVVERILSDPRGWAAAASFRRVSRGPLDFRVILASRRLTDRLCAPLQTNGIFSCRMGDKVVLNHWRWTHGAPACRDLRRYRTYLVNHEVGHALGRDHARCPGPGHPAPVMLQQTKGLNGCRANPWPLWWEREGARS